MKARCDSGELSRAVRVAQKFTAKSSSAAVTESVMIQVKDGRMLVRGTDFMRQCEIEVSTFGEEDGIAPIHINRVGSIFDSGGLVSLRTTKSNIIFEHDTGARVQVALVSVTMDDFPIWPESKQIATIGTDLLYTMAQQTDREEISGKGPMVACVHLLPHDGKVAVAAANGWIGAIGFVDDNITSQVSLDGVMLVTMLPIFDGIVNVEISKNDIIVLTNTGNRCAFPMKPSPDFNSIVNNFLLADPGKAVMQIRKEDFDFSIVQRTAQIDVYSDAALIGGENELKIITAGDGIEMNDVIRGDGTIENVFMMKCASFARLISSLRPAESYSLSIGKTIVHDEERSWLRVVGQDIHTLVENPTKRIEKILEERV